MATETVPAVFHPRAVGEIASPRLAERRIGWLYGGTGLALFAAMGLAGLAMRLTQAEVLTLSPSWFYRLMTLHGAGMLVGALMSMMGALWYVLRATVPLSLERMLAAYGAIVSGVVAVTVSVVVGGFAAGWTFLSPLPFWAVAEWDTWATVVFLVGMMLVGAGAMIFFVDLLATTSATYGGLRRALGVEYLRGRDHDPPPPQAIAAAVVSFAGLCAGAAGTTVLAALLGRAADAEAQLDALWAKNLTYFFGHTLANLSIYIAAGALYVLVPRFAGRPWKTTKPIVVAWLATLLIVMFAYSHHLYMDFVQPGVLQYVSLTASFAAVLPVAVVTIFTAMLLTWGSRYRWTLASTLVFLGFAGWAIGGVGAVIDSLIPVNLFFHNTLWVVAHFHTYLMLGVILWAIALVAYLLEQAAGRAARASRAGPAVALMLLGGYGLVGVWFLSGMLGLPRRYALHPAESGYSLVASVFVLVFAVGFLLLLAELVWLARAARATGADRSRTAPPEWPAPVPREPTPVLASVRQRQAALVLAGLAVLNFLPFAGNAGEDDVRLHHLVHAGQFLCGLLLGLVVASTPALVRRLRLDLPGAALTGVIAAPALMMLAMVPAMYEPLEDSAALHAAYHVGIGLLGVVTGLGAGRLGAVAGRLLAVLAVGMGLLYAAGVTGA
jgi:cytochrome c oxidase subunit 1